MRAPRAGNRTAPAPSAPRPTAALFTATDSPVRAGIDRSRRKILDNPALTSLPVRLFNASMTLNNLVIKNNSALTSLPAGLFASGFKVELVLCVGGGARGRMDGGAWE